MKKTIALLSISFLTLACTSNTPQPIKLNVDTCEFCKMTISNAHFASQLITQKGRCYKFDDITCMMQYAKSNGIHNTATLYIANFANESKFVIAQKAHYLKGGTISSPMRGNIIALEKKEEINLYQKKFDAEQLTWEQINEMYK